MLKRCMTPNPNSNQKALNQIIDRSNLNNKVQGPRINYDSFIYKDGVTKKKVVLSEMKEHYCRQKTEKKIETGSERKKTSHNSPAKDGKKSICGQTMKKGLNQNREIEEINDCFTLMKTTKLFQMSSLKDKLFCKVSDAPEKENTGIDNMRKKKKQIRQFIEDYVKNISIEEFRRYMQPSVGDRIKLINPNILNLSKYMSNVISKHNIEKIIQEFLLSQNKEKIVKKPISFSIDEICFPQQERLKQLLFHHVFIKNKDFQHLIFPSKSKQIYKSIHEQANQQNNFTCNFKYASDLHLHNFQEFKENKISPQQTNQDDQSRKLDKKLQHKKKQLLLAVQNGSTYDFLFLIIRWPKLLNFRDEKGNNILHIAAKNNQIQLYNLALKKMGNSTLKQRNNFGRTPIEIAKLFGSHDIMKRNKQLGQI